MLRGTDVDLVLLDIVMPGMDGYEVCRRIREQTETAYLPVVMVTASGDEQKIKALEAGADDFLTKPIDRSELLARVASLARVKRYQDTIQRQAAELADWNRELESRVDSQVAQLERMGRLRRFLSPQLAELIVDSGDETFLESHRREIVVVFCDLRGFTAFAESSEPEEVMGVLREYHAGAGRPDLPVRRDPGALHGRRPDGVLQRPGQVRGRAAARHPDGCRHAYAGCGVGGVLGATGSRPGLRHRDRAGLRHVRARIGFDGRHDYAAIGSVTNLADRLCADAESWQILDHGAVFTAAGPSVVGEDAGDRQVRGFSRPVRAFTVKGLDNARTVLMSGDLWTAPDEAPDVLSELDRGRAVPTLRRAAVTHARCVGRHAAQPRRRVGRRHTVDLARPSCQRQRQPVAGLRGTLPVPAASCCANHGCAWST